MKKCEKRSGGCLPKEYELGPNEILPAQMVALKHLAREVGSDRSTVLRILLEDCAVGVAWAKNNRRDAHGWFFGTYGRAARWEG